MIKKLLATINLSLIVGMLSVFAGNNVLRVINTEGIAGQDINIYVEIENQDDFIAFQFDIYWPSGFSYKANSLEFTGRQDGHFLSSSELGGGSGRRLIAFSFENKKFDGSSGAVVRFTLATPALPGVYDITFDTNATIEIVDPNSINVFSSADNGTVTLCGNLSATVASTNVSCSGANDGSITISNPSGASNYEYSIDGGDTWVSNGSFAGLSPATYNVMMRDADVTGCELILNSELELTDKPNPTLDAVTPEFAQICEGGLNSFTATGLIDGESKFFYTVTMPDNSVVTNNQTATVTGGTFTWPSTTYSGTGTYSFEITAIEVNGCTTSFTGITASFSIEAPPVSGTLAKTPDSDFSCEWNSDISAILTPGSGGNGTDELQYRVKDGNGDWSNWETYISGTGIQTVPTGDPEVLTRGVEIRTRRMADHCTDSEYTIVSWTIEPDPLSGNLVKTPDLFTVCEGTNVSAAIAGASGGNGTDETEYVALDKWFEDFGTWLVEYEGTWTAYTPGTDISTTGIAGIVIRTRRMANTCASGYAYALWQVAPMPEGPTLLAKNPVLTNICAGTDVSASFIAGSGGVNCSDQFQFRFGDADEWQLYTPGHNIVTNDKYGLTLYLQGRRSDCESGNGCEGTEWETLATWNIHEIFSAGSIAEGSVDICYNCDPDAIVSVTPASGGDGNFNYKWQRSIDLANWADIDDSNSAGYDPSNLLQTTWFRRLAKDGTCNTEWEISAGEWLVTISEESALSWLQENTVLSTSTGDIDDLLATFPSAIPPVIDAQDYKINSRMTITGSIPDGSTVDIWLTVNGGTPFQYANDVAIPSSPFWVTDLVGGTPADFGHGYGNRTEFYSITINNAGGNQLHLNGTVKVESIISKDGFNTLVVLDEETLNWSLPDAVAPQLVAVTPAEGAQCLLGESLVWTIQASDANLYSLEVDHSMQGTLPEFTVYADASNPYGSTEAANEFAAAGVSVTYDETLQHWTFDFGHSVTNMFIANGGITFYIVLRDVVGNQWGTMYGTTPENTFAYTFDNTAPILVAVTPDGGAQCLMGESFVWTVQASDPNLYSLEIDHSMQGILPEFTVYASETNPWGTPEDKAQFDAAGVTVAYNATLQQWTFDFGQSVTDMFIANGGITFYIVLEDCNENAFGTMFGTTPENTFTYILDGELPNITVTGFTANGDAMTGNLTEGYILNLDCSHTETDFLLEFAAGTTANEPLADEYFGLFLTDLEGVTESDLIAYYNASDAPQEYIDYLIDAANALEPFAFIKGSTVQLVDAAKYVVLGNDVAMTIPGDFPFGIYTVEGKIIDLTGCESPVTYTLKLQGDRTPPVINFTQPQDETMSACSFTTQAGVNAAFDTWFSAQNTALNVSGGRNPQISNDWSIGNYPTLHTGGSVKVIWTIADDCETLYPEATFTLTPGNLTVNNTTKGTWYCNIQAAIDDASEGDVITVAAGTYQENIAIDKELTLTGAGQNVTKIVANTGIVVDISADNVTLQGFEIEHTTITSLEDMGIRLNMSNNSTIQNNKFTMNSVGVMLLDAGDNTIYQNEFVSNAVGIYLEGTTDGLGNYDGGSNGPFYSLSLNNVIEENNIHHSVLVGGQGGQGIYVDASCEGNEILNNTISENAAIGYYAWKASNNTISGNIIQNNGSEGIQLQGSSGNTITGNMVSGNPFGFWMRSPAENVTNNTITGNTITENEVGIKMEDDYSGNNWPGVLTGNTISNNKIFGNTSFGLQVVNVNPATVIDAYRNWWGDVTGPAHATNPCGMGDAVSDNVSFSPWYFQEAMNTLNGLPALTLSDIDNISTITGTPIIVSTTVSYPDLTGYDTAVLADAVISTTAAGFPTGTKVIQVVYDDGVNPASTIPVSYDLTSATSHYLSTILGNAYPFGTPLARHTELDVSWTFVIEGATSAVTELPISIQSVSYLDRAGCNNQLGAPAELEVTFEDVEFVYNSNPACASGPAEVFYNETYPFVANNGGARILNDSKWEFFSDAAMETPINLPAGAKITIGEINGAGEYTWSRASELTVATSYLYGSAIVTQQGNPTTYTNGQLVPLERLATTNNWKAEIEHVPAGTYYVKVKNLAMLDVDGTNYNPQLPMGSIPQGPHGTFTEYIYLEDEFTVVYNEAVEVAISVDETNPLPSTPGGGTTTICANEPFEMTLLNINQGKGPMTFVYNVRENDINGTLIPGSPFTVSDVSTGETIYSAAAGELIAGTYFIETVSITDANGCQVQPVVMAAGYYNHSLVVNPFPIINSPVFPPTICSGNTFSYEPQSTIVGTTFAWSRAAVSGISNEAASGTGSPDEILNNTATEPVNVTYVYTLSANGCSQDYNVVLKVNPPAQVNKPVDQSVCNVTYTDEVVFATTNTGGTTTYVWSAPDGGLIGMPETSGTGNIPAFEAKHNSDVPVVVTVTVTPYVTDVFANCPGPAETFTYTIYPTPQVNFKANNVLLDYPVSSAAFCISEDLVFTMNEVKVGKAPLQSIAWEVFVNGSATLDPTFSGSATNVADGAELFSKSAPQIPGTYVVQVTELIDGNGCAIPEATLAQYYNSTITIYDVDVTGIETEYDEDFAGTCISSNQSIATISGTGKMVELFEAIEDLENAGELIVVRIAEITYTGDDANKFAIATAIKNLMIAETENGIVGELDGETITIPVVFANAVFPSCTKEVDFTINFDTAIPNAQQAMLDYIDSVPTSTTETFAYAPACIASDDPISSIEGTGTMATLMAGLPSSTAVVSIAGYTMTGDAAADMAGIKAAMIELMEAQTTNNTVGELNGKSISFNVVYANLLNPACQVIETYTIEFDTAIPDAQEALLTYIGDLNTTPTFNFEGLCLAADDKLDEITGTGLMVDLMAEIAALPAGVIVLSIAGTTDITMEGIKAAILGLYEDKGWTTIGDMTSLDVQVVFANALNMGCTEEVTLTITYDLSSVGRPIITNFDDTPVSTTATPGQAVDYKVVDRTLKGFTYVWQLVNEDGTPDVTTSNVLATSVSFPHLAEVAWNETGWLRVIETHTASGVTCSDQIKVEVTTDTPGLSGTIAYNKITGIPLPNITVRLLDAADALIEATTTDANGYYAFASLAGAEKIEVSTTMPWGGGNSTDALAIERRAVGMFTSFYNPVNTDFGFRDHVANVNANAFVNATDALQIKRRAVQLINAFSAGDWAFYAPDYDLLFTNSLPNTASIPLPETIIDNKIDILLMAYGDVNASYNPQPFAKQWEGTPLALNGELKAEPGTPFALPVRIIQNTELAAATLYLNYPAHLIEVLELESTLDGAVYNIRQGSVSLAWSSLTPVKLAANDDLIMLTARTKAPVSAGQVLFSMEQTSEFARIDGFAIEDIALSTLSINQNAVSTEDISTALAQAFSFYPNPFHNKLNIDYFMPYYGQVSLKLYNETGQEMATLVDEFHQPGSYKLTVDPGQHSMLTGIYFCRISVEAPEGMYSRMVKLMFVR